ncbi:MAG: hypothetical protein NTW93_10215 [Phycisphaerae bacterium]|nr:hypothetical protein [Phycisphaerae bacterium]
MPIYDFYDFIHRMSELDYENILEQAVYEGSKVDRSLYKVKGCVERCKMGGAEYVRQIGGFVFFMRNGQKPAGVSDEDFQMYYPVVKSLVDKGQLKSDILTMFSMKDKTD